jgi:hypothetical protein
MQIVRWKLFCRAVLFWKAVSAIPRDQIDHKHADPAEKKDMDETASSKEHKNEPNSEQYSPKQLQSHFADQIISESGLSKESLPGSSACL